MKSSVVSSGLRLVILCRINPPQGEVFCGPFCFRSYQIMDDMDIDNVIEVPDTPDRLMARLVNHHNEKRTSPRAFGSSNNSHIVDDRSLSRLRRFDIGNGRGQSTRLHMHPPKRIDGIVRSGERGKPICVSPSSNDQSTSGNYVLRKPNRNQNSVDDQDQGRAACIERGDALHLRQSSGCAEMRGDAFLHDCAEGSVNEKCSHVMPNSFKKIGMSSKGKEKVSDRGTDMPCASSETFIQTRPESAYLGSSSRHIGQKRLVRNGCISPNNTVTRNKESDDRINNCTQNLAPEEMCYQVSDDRWLSPEFCQLIAKEKTLSDRNKGKDVRHSNHDLPNSSISSRNNSVSSYKDGAGTDSVVRAADCVADLGGWRTSHCGNSVPCHNLNKNGSSFNGYHDITENVNGPRRFRRQTKRVVTSDNATSSSRLDSQNSELMILGSSGDSSIASLEFHGPMRQSSSRAVNLEDTTPRTRPQRLGGLGSVDDASRASQVEADELLARALQEELYNEYPSIEIDQGDDYAAMIRMSQEEENNHIASLVRNHHLENSRNSDRGRARRAPQPRASGNPVNRRAAQARLPANTRLQQSRRRRTRSSSFLFGENALHFPLDMDLEVRLDVLEALESVLGDTGDPGTSMDFFGTQRDFTEDDYEILLALDENNVRTGASVHQISSLPESKVQNDSFGEACTICLEVPAKGDTIRHLPCLHKFHKDCIDPWLSRSRSCPVCKSSIS
ncbi:hypothetical protein MLD38_018158 [Melastoma candidum]|uniref:Uncharacterized protein n=1 Tax=Melastoma candidum TaxID=119954 RepID=A0ACB9QT03_9MYRT|nr:hypothetical protein MLD38_018158 [Melastoma candidum]